MRFAVWAVLALAFSPLAPASFWGWLPAGLEAQPPLTIGAGAALLLDVLLAPTELKSGDRIQIGDTELLFVALCSESFEWQDNA